MTSLREVPCTPPQWLPQSASTSARAPTFTDTHNFPSVCQDVSPLSLTGWNIPDPAQPKSPESSPHCRPHREPCATAVARQTLTSRPRCSWKASAGHPQDALPISKGSPACAKQLDRASTPSCSSCPAVGGKSLMETPFPSVPFLVYGWIVKIKTAQNPGRAFLQRRLTPTASWVRTVPSNLPYLASGQPRRGREAGAAHLPASRAQGRWGCPVRPLGGGEA